MKTANEILMVPLRAVAEAALRIIITALPAAGVTQETTGAPAVAVPLPTLTNTLEVVVIRELVRVNV